MVIVLDNYNEIKTDYLDFITELKHHKDGIRCCLDIDLIFYDYTPTQIDDFKLIPLDKFTCKRSIVGNNGTNIVVETTFGITKGDFINTGFQEVELDRKNYAKLKGLLISCTNPYFDIINGLSQHLELVGAENYNSFVLDECDLSELKLVPFNLKFVDNHFIVSDVEQEMATTEYDSIVEQLYCSEYAF